jgi:hypothetical protein
MAINFIANDPRAAGAAATSINPSAARPANRIAFNQAGLPPEALYPAGTDDFVAWQAREGALRALNTFEAVCGTLRGWQDDPARRALVLAPNDGPDLNAYYDRASVSFFEGRVNGAPVFSGASVDVVAHEVGHAILDAIRPGLWNVSYLEAGAFHEAFGDVIAIMTALADIDQRRAVLAADPTLGAGNFVEATAEELSWAIAQNHPGHNAGLPRRGLNPFRWALPETLPANGGPGAFINEAHSFGQLVSGIYYQLIREIYHAGQAGEAGLWTACQAATRLLADAARTAPIRPRFIQSVCRTMLLNDRAASGGANETFIRNACAAHGVNVSASTLLSAQAALGPASAAAAVSSLTAPMKKQLKSLLAAPTNARFVEREIELGGQAVLEATTELNIDLSSVSSKLAGVVAKSPQPAIVGHEAGAVSLLGAIDTSGAVAAEVQQYVKSLIKRGQIAFPGAPSGGGGGGARGAGYLSSRSFPSHEVVKRGSQLVLERRAFVCGCCPRP